MWWWTGVSVDRLQRVLAGANYEGSNADGGSVGELLEIAGTATGVKRTRTIEDADENAAENATVRGAREFTPAGKMRSTAPLVL